MPDLLFDILVWVWPFFFLLMMWPVWSVVRSFINRRAKAGPETLTAMRSYISPDNPKTEQLDFQYGKRQIILDPSAGMLTFIRCHTSNKFWTLGASAEFTCPVTEVLDVYHQPHYSGSRHNRRHSSYETRIVTAHGKAMIHLPEKAAAEEDLRPIREYLAAVSEHTPSAGFTQSPTFVLVIGFGLAFIVMAALYYATE